MQYKLTKRLAHIFAAALLATSTVSGVTLAITPTISAATVSTSSIKLDEKAAAKKFNQKYHGAKVDEIKLESKHKQYRYEVSGFDQNKEYTVNINAKTGKIINSKSERLDNDDQPTALKLKQLISRKKANRLAEKAAKNGKGQEWVLETENGQPVWEVTVVDGHHETDVKINATNSKIVSVDQDD